MSVSPRFLRVILQGHRGRYLVSRAIKATSLFFCPSPPIVPLFFHKFPWKNAFSLCFWPSPVQVFPSCISPQANIFQTFFKRQHRRRPFSSSKKWCRADCWFPHRYRWNFEFAATELSNWRNSTFFWLGWGDNIRSWNVWIEPILFHCIWKCCGPNWSRMQFRCICSWWKSVQ